MIHGQLFLPDTAAPCRAGPGDAWLVILGVSPGEFLTLAAVGLENRAYNARLGLRELARLGGQRWWWRLRLALRLTYLTESPFRLCRRDGAASDLPEEDLIYGETPILTAWELLKELSAGPGDTVVDLGCGRGQNVLVANMAFGSRGVGTDVLPAFVERATAVARSLSLENVDFQQADFRDQDPPEGDIYFLAPTTLVPASWEALRKKMYAAPEGSRAVSVTCPLPELGWEMVAVSKRPYSWGLSTTYIQRRK